MWGHVGPGDGNSLMRRRISGFGSARLVVLMHEDFHELPLKAEATHVSHAHQGRNAMEEAAIAL